ncbi:hypothetical protein [Cerasicoccus maritimus]|uniref:hypothetical protein n=1 Tax=Cerasicoccus maritimus TaxID=490089 RepID=UPI0028525D30|nr:hypothetical protein [Cerasicoccus maritimus]
MKVKVSFSISQNSPRASDNLSNESFAVIKALSPREGKNPNYHIVELYEDDPNLIEILRLVKQETGMVPYMGDQANPPGTFYMPRLRMYSAQDLAGAEYLSLEGTIDKIATICENADIESYVVDIIEDYEPKRRIGPIDVGYYLAVSEEVAELLRSEDLIGLELVDLPTNKPLPTNQSAVLGLSSSITLPRMLNTVIEMEGDPFPGDPATWEGADEKAGCFISDGAYGPVIVRYDAKELSKLPFDIALSYEAFGRYRREASHYRIISQRFYQVLRKHKLDKKLKFSPVRLE